MKMIDDQSDSSYRRNKISWNPLVSIMSKSESKWYRVLIGMYQEIQTKIQHHNMIEDRINKCCQSSNATSAWNP
jgi:hypothetical protein